MSKLTTGELFFETETNTLFYGEVKLAKFSATQSAELRTIFSCMDEEEWPSFILDPVPPQGTGTETHEEKLSRIVSRWNRRQKGNRCRLSLKLSASRTRIHPVLEGEAPEGYTSPELV